MVLSDVDYAIPKREDNGLLEPDAVDITLVGQLTQILIFTIPWEHP